MTETRIEKDLDDMFQDLQNSFSAPFSGLFYCVKVTQVKDSFYVLIRKKTWKSVKWQKKTNVWSGKRYFRKYIQ